MNIHTLALFGFLFIRWLANCVPITQQLGTNYARLNFALKNEDLAGIGSVLKQINAVAARRRGDSFSEKSYDAVEPLEDIDRNNNTGWRGDPAGSNAEPQDAGASSKNASSTENYLFEGDILLSSKQAAVILAELLNQNVDDVVPKRIERSAVLYDNTAKWSMPIKYDIDPNIGSQGIRAIEEALEHWRTHTCVWFQRQSGLSDDDHIYFFKGGADSCYSHVGKIGGKQPISVGNNCAKMGYVAHEIGHALGMWHEQARPDSENYVRILWQNVLDQRESNFLKRTWKETETYGIPYDLGSVMHYGPYAFSAGEKGMTLETRIPAYRRTIGQREAPSFLDVKTINKVYCEGKCQTLHACANGGYTHPGFCNACLCPDGLGGTYCDQPEDAKNAPCGGVIYVNGEWINISSPNYPEHYKNNQRCSWILRSPSGTRVLLEFTDIFQLACGATCSDYVEVKNDTTDFALTGMRLCCFERPKEPIYSQSNEMIVIFNSGYTSYPGFKARIIQCTNTGTSFSVIGWMTPPFLDPN